MLWRCPVEWTLLSWPSELAFGGESWAAGPLLDSLELRDWGRKRKVRAAWEKGLRDADDVSIFIQPRRGS